MLTIPGPGDSQRSKPPIVSDPVAQRMLCADEGKPPGSSDPKWDPEVLPLRVVTRPRNVLPSLFFSWKFGCSREKNTHITGLCFPVKVPVQNQMGREPDTERGKEERVWAKSPPLRVPPGW